MERIWASSDYVHRPADVDPDVQVEANKPFGVMVYPDRTHGIFEGRNTRLHLYSLVTRFLAENLPAGPAAKRKSLWSKYLVGTFRDRSGMLLPTPYLPRGPAPDRPGGAGSIHDSRAEGVRMVVSKEKRRKRRRLRALQNESAWLQKALFALRKAEAANEKAADAVDQDAEDYALTIDGEDMPIDVFETALQKRADVLLATTREMRQALV